MQQLIDVAVRALPAEHGQSSFRHMLRRVEDAETTALAAADITAIEPFGTPPPDPEFYPAAAAGANVQQFAGQPEYLPVARHRRLDARHLANAWMPAVVTVLGVLAAGTLAVAMLGLPGSIFSQGQPARVSLSAIIASVEADTGALPGTRYEPKILSPAEAADPMAATRARAEAMLALLPEQTAPPNATETAPRLRLGSILITRQASETILPIRIEDIVGLD